MKSPVSPKTVRLSESIKGEDGRFCWELCRDSLDVLETGVCDTFEEAFRAAGAARDASPLYVPPTSDELKAAAKEWADYRATKGAYSA